MLKNLTISGKVNFITEIIAIITWAILLIAAKDDWQFFAVFSVPLLILIPICGWFLMPVSKKISEKGKNKRGWWKAAWYAIALELTEKDFVDFLRLEFINLGYDEDIVKRLQEQNWTAALAYMLEEGKDSSNDALVI